MRRNRLITIGFSHFCEKARWALDRLGVAYDEEPHLPLLHWAASFGSGGGRTVPVLVTDAGVFRASTEILVHLDARAPARAKLYPADAEARKSTSELEELFDRRLGPATRRVVYFHMLPARELMLETLRNPASAPIWERTLVRPFYPLLRAGLRRGLRIDEAGVERSRQAIGEVFELVAARLRDGRRYLVGDAFTAADLAFAALAAPVVQPPEYGFSLPPLERVPEATAALVREYRESDAGRFALRVYADERRRVAD